jgi:hypothetical protein
MKRGIISKIHESKNGILYRNILLLRENLLFITQRYLKLISGAVRKEIGMINVEIR